MSENTRKLIALRSRTDNELLILVQRELDRGFAIASVAPSRNSYLFSQAQRSFATASTLLQKISQISPKDKAAIEKRLKELRALMDRTPAYPRVAYPVTYAC